MRRWAVALADELKAISEAIKKLANKQLLVGIPMETSAREQSEFLNMLMGGRAGGTVISNASLGYIHEFGSPAVNIPARPHLVPGVTKAMDEITARMKAAATAALDGDSAGADQQMSAAGQAAVNAVQQMITDKLDPPIKPESYLSRTTGRSARQKRAGKQGISLMELAQAEAPQATPLVDTGAYRRSITFVIRDRK